MVTFPSPAATAHDRRDIESRADLRALMERFYGRLLADERVAHLFAGLDLERHFVVLVDFWAMMLLGEDSYRRNTLQKHAHLPLLPVHFDVWLAHFDESVDERFEGARARLAKERAHSIAAIFRSKLTRARGSDPA